MARQHNKQIKVMRGYYIRVQRHGTVSQLQHVWAIVPDLPAEWNAIKADPSVTQAELFSSTQRNKRADRRKILERFTHPR
jgi:hypothetical protein